MPEPILDPEAGQENFYHEFTLRNAGFISPAEQDALRRSHILVAGCGSTGGAVVEPLIRTGAESLTLVDNGSYELNNANRQNMVLDDIGVAKVDVLARRARAINPYLRLNTVEQGITPDNAHALVRAADVVVDAVDVTTRAGLEMKFLLHQACHANGKPVVCGYDMAATQYVPVFDYREPGLAMLGGAVTAEQVATLDPMQICTLLVPAHHIPMEMFEELERQRAGKPYTSQLAIAANLFGVMATSLVLDMVNQRKVCQDACLDIWRQLRPRDPDVVREKLAAGAEILRRWRSAPAGAPDPLFLERSLRHYREPLLKSMSEYEAYCIDRRGAVLTFAIAHQNMDDDLARQLLRFAFVHYARVGFINPHRAARDLLHNEAPESLSPLDVHIILVDERDYRLLAYSTLKAPVGSGVRFGDASRPDFGVEGAFGRDLYADIEPLAQLSVEQVREIGRVTRQPLEDRALAARVGMMLLSAYRKLLADPARGIRAVVGDGEPRVTLRNLLAFGFNPHVLPSHKARLPDDHLYYPRYQGRDVRPFWLMVDEFDETRASDREALLDLPDNQDLLEKLSRLRETDPQVTEALL